MSEICCNFEVLKVLVKPDTANANPTPSGPEGSSGQFVIRVLSVA